MADNENSYGFLAPLSYLKDAFKVICDLKKNLKSLEFQILAFMECLRSPAHHHRRDTGGNQSIEQVLPFKRKCEVFTVCPADGLVTKSTETFLSSKTEERKRFLRILAFLSFFLPFFFFFFPLVFLGLNPWHRDVPKLGVEVDLQLPAYTTAIATQDLSCICDLHHSLQQCWILDPLNEARARTCILMDTDS